MAKEMKNQVTANNAAEAAVETKEEAVMNNAVEQAQPVAAPVATTEAGTQVPAEIPQQTFAEKHPKLAAFGQKAKKVGKWVGLGAAVVGGLFVAHKLGEASGFDKATDAYNNASAGSNDPEPDDYDPEDDLGDEGIEEVNEN